ncbi:MAG TPA: DnaA/Hda family protein [Rhabdochlamydiaceae bacterium]|jgi:chromosomal replication initiator protein|nr:DnaA/Hda family protein [Rhabdochlamydiaceae bacterium]
MKLWEDFLQTQEKNLGSEAINKWAKPLKIVFFDAGNLYLEAQDAFQLNWFEQHLRPQIRNHFRNNNHRLIKVHLSLVGAVKDKKIWKPVLNLSQDNLTPNCRLETFFPGTTNLISFSMLQESLEKTFYNPIYLHGPSGSGKTHLLMAASAFLIEQKKQCFYVTAGTLTNHIVAAMRTGSMQKLRAIYRQHDVLLVDDVHQLAHRSATQEELFHTFNTLHMAGKQIILAGNSLPSQLEGIEPRLTSRFEWGLVLPLLCLTAPEQKEFFHKRAQEKKLTLSQEIETFLLHHLTSVKSLQSALETLSIRKGGNEITLQLVQKWTTTLFEDQKRQALTPEKIVQATAEIFEIPAADILGRAQNQTCSAPRQVAMYLCRSLLKIPYLKIAAIFSRDHSTVMTSVKSIEKKIEEQDGSMLSTINSIKSKFKS